MRAFCFLSRLHQTESYAGMGLGRGFGDGVMYQCRHGEEPQLYRTMNVHRNGWPPNKHPPLGVGVRNTSRSRKIERISATNAPIQPTHQSNPPTHPPIQPPSGGRRPIQGPEPANQALPKPHHAKEPRWTVRGITLWRS